MGEEKRGEGGRKNEGMRGIVTTRKVNHNF